MALDNAYSLALIRARRLESVYVSRDLDGFFEHVWDVHPVVGASPEHDPSTAVGPPTSSPLAPRHTMVEGKVGRFPGLVRVPVLNLALAQAELLAHLQRIIRRERVTLISANDPYYTGLLGLLLARANRIPLMVNVVANHDVAYAEQGVLACPRLFGRRSIEKRVDRLVFSHADLVAVGSEDNRCFAEDNGARPDRVHYFRYGDLVDPVHHTPPGERVSVRAELGLGDRPFVITVSRFEQVKYTGDIISAVAAARRRIPSVAAVVVGDGALRPDLEAQAKDLGIQDHVVFTGTRDQAWIARALTSADVVLSAITGRALVEASLSGTPIVAYDFEWQSEFVVSGENGLIVPHRDTDAMGEAACRLIDDPELGTRLAARARERTAELWDPQSNRAGRRAALARLLGVALEDDAHPTKSPDIDTTAG